MAVEYKFERTYIRFTLIGSFDTDDMKAEAEKLRHDADFRPNQNVKPG